MKKLILTKDFIVLYEYVNLRLDQKLLKKISLNISF